MTTTDSVRAGTRRALLRRTALLLSGTTLAGCGFRLRGAQPLAFRTLWTGFPSTSPVGAELRRQLRAIGGTELVDRPENADARLEVLQDLREREVLAFSSTGRPRQYQLRLRLRYRLHDGKGRDFISSDEIVLRREISTDDLQVATRTEEEALLYRDMQNDMVQQLLRRLAAAGR